MPTLRVGEGEIELEADLHEEYYQVDNNCPHKERSVLLYLGQGPVRSQALVVRIVILVIIKEEMRLPG